MTGNKPFPITPEYLAAIKEAYNIESDEEASQIDNIRKFSDERYSQIKAPEVDREDRTIEQDNVKVKISVLRPLGSKDETLPVILFMHGGGWVLGSLVSSASLTNQLVNQLHACLVFVDYSLSPEMKYPVALEECYSTLLWIQANSKLINIDPTNIVISGESCGGNLAAALTILAKERGNTSISYQILYYPVTAADFYNDSYNEHKDNHYLSREIMQYFWDAYLNNEDEKKLPTAAPLTASVDELKGLPPALIITAEIDVLRTEAELYAKKLTEAGVQNICTRYLEIEHGFTTDALPQADMAIAQTVYILKKHWNLK